MCHLELEERKKKEGLCVYTVMQRDRGGVVFSLGGGGYGDYGHGFPSCSVMYGHEWWYMTTMCMVIP